MESGPESLQSETEWWLDTAVWPGPIETPGPPRLDIKPGTFTVNAKAKTVEVIIPLDEKARYPLGTVAYFNGSCLGYIMQYKTDTTFGPPESTYTVAIVN